MSSLRSSFPSSHRARARALACAMLSAGIAKRVSLVCEALRGGGGGGSSLARRSASSAPSLADPGRRFKSARPSSSVNANAIRSPVASATRPVTTPCRCAAPADAPGAPAGSRTVTCRLSRRSEATAVRFPLDAAHASRRRRPTMQTSLCSPSCSRSATMIVRARSPAPPSPWSKRFSARSAAALS